jgi:hypothetical protein
MLLHAGLIGINPYLERGGSKVPSVDGWVFIVGWLDKLRISILRKKEETRFIQATRFITQIFTRIKFRTNSIHSDTTVFFMVETFNSHINAWPSVPSSLMV